MHRTKSSKNITVAILKQKYHIQTPKKLGKKKTSFNHERKAIFLLTAQKVRRIFHRVSIVSTKIRHCITSLFN